MVSTNNNNVQEKNTNSNVNTEKKAHTFRQTWIYLYILKNLDTCIHTTTIANNNASNKTRVGTTTKAWTD